MSPLGRPVAVERRYEMGLARADFMRLLPAAVDPGWRTTVHGASGTSGEVAIEVFLAERPERRLARIAIPVLEVVVRLSGPDEGAIEASLERFLLAFQRAGG